MKDKFQSFVDGMTLGGGSIQHPLSIHSASIGTRWKPRGLQVLMTLVFLFTLGIGQMWAAYDVPADGTVDLATKVNNGGRFNVEASGVYHFRKSSGYSFSAGDGIKTQSNQCGVVFYVDKSTEIEVFIKHKEAKNAHTVTVHVYSIPESEYQQFDNNKAGAAESNRTFSTGPSTSSDDSYTIAIAATSDVFSGKKTLASGYYAIVPVGEKSNTYFSQIKFTAAAKTNPTVTFNNGAYTVGGSALNLSTLFSSNSDGAVTYTVKTDGGTSASISGTSFTASAAGTAVVTASQAATSTYNAKAVDANIVVSVPSTPTHGITYNNTKGATNPNPDTYYEGIGVASFEPLADVDGFHFTGWSPASIAADASGDKTINATWVPTYNVSFDKGAGGGTVPAGFQKWEGATFDLPGQGDMTAPSGRVFGGWKVGVSDKYAAGDTYTMGTTSVEFVAQWDVLVEQVIYSWEGAEGGATEVGGTVAGSADGLINQLSAGYYCLKIDGNNSYSGNLVTITLSGEEKVKTGDKITYWGFYNKSSSANARPKMRDANSPNAQIFDDPNNLPNLNGGGDPAKRTFTVPADINTNAVQFTRSQTGSNTWISKLQITREKAVPEEDLRTVTFNTNGGSSIAAVIVEKGTTVAKPADPTKAHCRFAGWQLSGSDYDFSTAVNSNITLDAVWTQLYTVTFANGGGSGDAPAAVADKAEGETFSVPANTFTAPEGKEFDKWNDGSADYAPGATYTVGSANVTLTAVWKPLVAKYTVIFKDGETELGTKLFDVSNNPSDADINKTKPLFTFAAWQKDEADIALDAAFWATVAKDATVTLTARWAKAYAQDVDLEGLVEASGTSADWQTYLSNNGYAFSTSNVTLDAKASGKTYENWPYQGLKAKEVGAYVEGNIHAGKLVIVKLGRMAAAANVSFDGTSAGTATGLDAAEPAGQLNYFYAENESKFRYETTNAGACVLKAITITNPFQVTFNANGGDPVASQYGHPSVTLPSASKGTASLLGWFDDPTDGNEIGEPGDTYTPSANITLYAHWEDVSTDARLASISFSSDAGTLSPAFDPEVTSYTYTMPYGTAAIPTITGATSVNAKAQDPIIGDAAAAWGEAQTVKGVAQSGDKKTYTITMAKAPKDGVCLIKGNVGNNTFVIDEEASLLSGTPSKSNVKSESSTYETLTGWKFNSRPAHLGLTLSEGTFQAGDVVEVFVTDVANGGGGTHKMRVFDSNEATPAHVLAESEADMVQGVNRLVLPATSTSSLYLHRGASGADYENWNPYVAYFAVYRPMMPTLTAITIDGRDGEIDALVDNKFNVTIPHEAVLSSLTVVPTIIRNAAHATTPEAVISNEGAWIEGANTYRVMDKDGDYTDYTITLTRDVLKHTVSFNTHGGSAVASELVVDGESLEAAPAAPEKEDYLFQGWAETDGGAIVDVTTFAISADKEFHAVWAPDGAIKLIEAGAINHTNFITGATMSEDPVTIETVDYDYALLGSTASNPSVNALNKLIAYNATTTKTKVMIDVYNKNTNTRTVKIWGVVEGSSEYEELASITMDNGANKRIKSAYYEFNNLDGKNRTIYIGVPSSVSDVAFLQVKVVESGDPIHMFGEVGYSINFNKGRLFGPSATDLAFEGMTYNLSSGYQALNSASAVFTKSMSHRVDVASAVTMTVTTANAAKFYVDQATDGTGNETASTGAHEFDLTAGTWYINVAGSNLNVSSISFALPKCEKPVFGTMSDIDLCAGDAFTAIDGTATVSDGGVVSYKWYKEGSETVLGTAATYTPSADGNYYVVATNSLADHQDNSATSDVVTVEHFAAAAIVTAPEDIATQAGQEKTLTIVASGANLQYVWYTCDDAMGTNPVAIVPAQTTASLTVTVPDGVQYYKVAVTDDCGADLSAVVKVEGWTDLPQVDVTESTVWDMNNVSASAINLKDDYNPSKQNVRLLLANIEGVNNNASFNSQALMFEGQHIGRTSGGVKHLAGQYVQFNVTVPGMVSVTFASNGSAQRTIQINGKQCSRTTNDGTYIKYDVAVEPGSVEIEDVQGYVRISKIEFKAEYNYHRENLNPNNIGTLCWTNNAVLGGATLYELAGKNENNYLVFDEVPENRLEAGKPYVFVPENGNTEIKVYNTDDEDALTDPVQNESGMQGTFEVLTTVGTTEGDGELWYKYIITNNHYIYVDYTNCRLGAYRAYVIGFDNMNVVTNEAPEPGSAPRRRLVVGGNQAPTVATGIDDVQGGNAQCTKVLIDGQLYILRGEQMFDATGRLVK